MGHVAVVILIILVWFAAIFAIIFAFSFESRLRICETEESSFCPSISCKNPNDIPTRNNGKQKYEDIF